MAYKSTIFLNIFNFFYCTNFGIMVCLINNQGLIMQIVEMEIKDLINYEKNARTHSKEQLKDLTDSIKKFGFNDPIEIDNDNVIISGHARFLAASKAGLKKVPTVKHSHLTNEDKIAYTIAANKIAQKAEWDNILLQSEFNTLLENNYDLKNTGFSQQEIDEILKNQIIEENCDETEEIIQSQENSITILGDVWILGNHRLMCGDSTDINCFDKLVNNHKPILMVTDPPYGVNYDPEWRDGADLGIGERSKGKVENDDKIDWKDAYSIFTGDVCYVWHAGKYTHIVAQNLQDCDFNIVSQIIWSKQHFVLSRGDYHWQHEPCWYAVKKNKNHNWQGARDQSTIWEIKNNNSFGNHEKEETWGHGTQKPLECMLKPILNNSSTGEYIYDPFGGSGTTLIACEKSSRKCLMMELSPKYCDMIIKRWQKLTGKKAILESTGETFDGKKGQEAVIDSN